MSCRSRANRLRSFSTAGRAFSCSASSSCRLRRRISRIPKIATEAARMPNTSPAWLPHPAAAPNPRVTATRTATVPAATRSGSTMEAGDRQVDDAGQPGLAQAPDHHRAEGDEAEQVRHRLPQRRVVDQPLALLADPDPQRHVESAEGDGRHHPDDPGELVAVVPAGHQRVDEEEQPHAREQRTEPVQLARSGPLLAHGLEGSHVGPARAGQTRAVSRAIAHAAPPTKTASPGPR